MEAVGAASAILGIATAGVQCSVKLVTFAGQVKTAPEQIASIAEDVSLSANILQQLGELTKENLEYEPRVSDNNGTNATNNNVKPDHDSNRPVSKQSVFNATGLETVVSLAKKSEVIFESLNQSLRKASKQLHEKSGISKVKLSSAEMFKWPFLFPEIESMRNELSSIKGTLMLMLQVAMLAYSRRMMEGYGESQHITTIAVYSREDQEVLVRSIVAAQTSRLGSPGKDHSENSNDLKVNGVTENVEKNPGNQENDIHDEQLRDIGSIASLKNNSSERHRPQSQFEVSALSPLQIFQIWLVSPKASITNQQIHISYSGRIIKLQNLTIESQLREWKTASNTSILDQLTALDSNEHEALDIISNHSDQTIWQEGTLEWIHFGDYCTLIQGFENPKARTLTIVLSKAPQPALQFKMKEEKGKEKNEEIEERKTTWIKVHRKHLDPETLTAYQLPWDWDTSDSNYLVIKRWITEDYQEELFAHTRRLRDGEILKQDAVTEMRVNDRNKDKMFLIRKKPPLRRSSDFLGKIRQALPFINRRKQEWGNSEQQLPYAVEGDINDEKFQERLQSQFGYTSEEVEELLNRKTADGERRRKSERIIEEQGETGQQIEEETNEGEDIEALSDSDDAEGIVDALLSRYTR